MGISLGSIGTGLPKDIVKQIIEAEKIPIRRMEAGKADVQAKKDLVGELTELVREVETKLSQNANARSLAELKVDTNDNLVDINVDKNIAGVGNYKFEVVQLAQKSSALSSGFKDPNDSYVGVGFLQYELPDGEVRDIYIDSDNSSLRKIAQIINDDRENLMRATVINDGSGSDTPWRLLISLEKTGAEELAHFPYLYFVDGEEDFYIDKEIPAKNAVIKLDGFAIENPANKIKDIIPGVTIDLKKAKPGDEFGINIGQDMDGVVLKIDEMIESINKVLNFIKEQNNLDESSDTKRTLGGDLLLQSIESRLRSVLFQDVLTSEGYRRMADLGVSFERSGLLSINKDKFEAALASNFQVASEILTGGGRDSDGKEIKGFIDNARDVVKLMLRSPNGILNSRSKTLQSRMDQIDRRISSRQRLIDQKEKILKDKFAKLEGVMAKIRAQGAGLASLAAPPTAVKSPSLGG